MKIGKTISKAYRKSYIKLFKEYEDIFSWSYKELKTYDTHIIQHNPIETWDKTFPTEIMKVPSIFRTLDVSRNEEIVKF